MLLAATSLVAALAVAELGLRAVGPSPPAEGLRSLHEPRPDRPWLYGLRPGAVGRLEISGDVLYRINADGFRDRRYAIPKPPGTFRIVVLGDSIAFGYGVEERDAFPKVLESRLSELAPAAHVEVVNLGVSGYNAYTEAELLKDVGVKYQPDLVLLQFCINDLNDPTVHFDAQTRLHLGSIPDAAYPDPTRRAPPPRLPSIGSGCRRRLALCALLDDALLAWTTPEPDAVARRAAVAPVVADGPEWRWLERLYQEMARETGRVGARFVVLAFPYASQMHGRRSQPVEDRLVAMGERDGWVTVDLLPAFQDLAARSHERLFFDWWHPKATGHALAAEQILDALACRGLLPPGVGVACPHELSAAGGK
ncbi:MAG TPA: SGNH/GDSL hydrolase family protein [Candidatus Bathyarchaeia archaeon]|nr:SGNH/GDSL hydrolase family protein [Candidatus Bathyarchaeia archaeon]